MTQNLEEDEVVVQSVLTKLTALAQHCSLVLIVTDMGRGVVPMEKTSSFIT
ncbi:hypothetical protein OL548_18970 [Lysinibacillus sp. MHQ-1]|nr:hypothetical protein OL548_18970 [Lysinibacillus sp. MHQ-1]